MREIWKESVELDTSPKFAHQARFILKTGWLCDIQILEVDRVINRDGHTQRELPKRNEKLNIKIILPLNRETHQY